jgi:hypothetical protein
VSEGTQDLGFSTAAYVLAGGEIVGPFTTEGYVYGCYGCSGYLAWQRATAAGGCDWYTIQQAYARQDDANW